MCCRKESLFNKQSCESGYPHVEQTRYLFLTLKKKNSKWVCDFNVKPEAFESTARKYGENR
jgi:hypothetical protein